MPTTTSIKPSSRELYADTHFAIGDRVWYFGAWGSHNPVVTEITGVGMKNGQRVYDNGLGLWGYTEQYHPRTED